MTPSTVVPVLQDLQLFVAMPGNCALLLADAPKFTIVAVTDGYVNISGRAKEDLVGKGLFEAFPTPAVDLKPGSEQHLLASLEHVLSEKEPHRVPLHRYDISSGDGSFVEHYWSAVNKPVVSQTGEVVYIIHAAEDVTEKIHAEKQASQLKEVQRSFQLFMQAPVAVCIVSGADYRVELVNEQMLQLLGRTAAIVGNPIEASLPEARVQGLLALLDQVRATGKSVHQPDFPAEILIDGVREQRYFDLVFQPYYHSAGDTTSTGIFCVAYNVTKQVHAQKLLEEAKAETERQKRVYETITASTPDLMYVFDLNYRFVYANEALLNMWGKPWEEAIGKGLTENGYEPWHAAMHEREIDQVAATKQSIRGEVSFPHAVLGRRVYDYILVPVLNKQGQVEAVAGTTRDITDIKRAEEAVRKSEQQQSFLLRLSDHLRTLTDPVSIEYEAASLVAQQLEADRVGYAEDGGDGQTFTITADYTNGVPSLKGKYRYDDYGPELLRAIREGQTVVRHNIADEPSLSEAEKAAHAALRLGATLNVPLLRNGELIALFFVHFRQAHRWSEEEVFLMKEVAERTWEAVVRARTEQALRQSEERFRIMANAVPLSMWIADAEGRTEFLNKHWCDYCGEPYTETTAADIALKYLHPEDAPKVMQAFLSASQTGEPFEVEQRNRSKEGEYRWFLNRANPYRDPATGRLIKWYGVGVDIHDRKLAEETIRRSEEALERKVQERTAELEKVNKDLERSNKNLEQFAYAASHDLKEPMRKIQIFSDRLRERLQDKLQDEDKHFFSRILNATHRMNSLIDDLLLYSHVSSHPVQEERVDLNEKVQLVIEDLEVEIAEKNASITTEHLPTIRGHRRQLQQLFQNLLGNAIKYAKMNVPPQIHISYRLVDESEQNLPVALEKREGGYCFIEVRDNGIGFSQEDAERIFSVFTRLHGNAEYSGTGVGLSIVQKVVQNHGGYIWAESTPGEGAAFKILLPAK